jgi:BirA family transcriptional regulator, biotin operon repressor / biotin---[acetyl-CoA-carboxylase] ligase
MSDRLQADIIKAAVAESNKVNIDVIVHQSIDSTNSWSMQQCKRGKVLPFASFAEQQEQGRGRRGKQWITSKYSNIAMSLSWPFAASYSRLQLLPLSVAMAVVETLEEIGLAHVQVKWPNDVLVRGKKIAGILIETQPVNDIDIAVVTGVGLNYRMPADKIKAWRGKREVFIEITDIERETKKQAMCEKTNRADVAASLLKNIINVVQGYQTQPGYQLERFREQYDYCKGKSVEIILDNDEILTGLARGVNDDAELIVLIDGEQRTFNSADVSVKTS